MTAVSVGMAKYAGGLPTSPRVDEGPLWFDEQFVGFGEDGPRSRLIASGDVTSVVVERAGRQMGFWPAWLLTRTFGIFGFLVARRDIPTTVISVRTTTGDTAGFHVRSFKVADTVRLLAPWLRAHDLPIGSVTAGPSGRR